MVYIIILNWKNASDTIDCLNSLFNIKDVAFRIVVCDNQSPDDSYIEIRNWLQQQSSGYMAGRCLVELNRKNAEFYYIDEDEQGIYLIQTGDNLGFAGGNNVGIRFALNQNDMDHVWILNNDTIVEPDALALMVAACNKYPKIGICGSRLVYEHDRNRMQGLGGIYNSWLGTTYHYAANEPATAEFDDDVISHQIDYVIGASMLLSREMLDSIGLFCEEYFLYFEELDITYRAQKLGYRHYVVSNAVVYHKEGASTGVAIEKSAFADMLSIKNRLLFTRKFHKEKIISVWFSLWGVLLNRIRRFQLDKAKLVFFILLRIK